MEIFGFKIQSPIKRSAPYAEKNSTAKEESITALPYWQNLFAVDITEQSSLTLSAFYNGVDAISSDLAKLPFGTFQRLGKTRKQIYNHPTYRLLGVEPNDILTSFLWRKSMFINTLIRGNHYTIIRRNFGVVEELDPVDLEKKYVQQIEYNADVWYKISGEPNLIHHTDVIHIKNFSKNGKSGKGVIEFASESMGIAIGAQKYGKGFFENSSNPTGVLTTEQTLKKEHLEMIKNSWNKNYSGVGPKGVAVLHGGMKFQDIYLPPEQAQFILTRKFTVTDVARWLNMPPHKLKDLEKSSFSNIENQSIDYVQSCLLGWVTQTEQEINKKLFSITEKRKGYFAKMNLNALLRGDIKTRWQSYKDGFFTGALSPNEIRALENMNPRDGGDDFFIPANMQSGEQFQKIINDGE